MDEDARVEVKKYENNSQRKLYRAHCFCTLYANALQNHGGDMKRNFSSAIGPTSCISYGESTRRFDRMFSPSSSCHPDV